MCLCVEGFGGKHCDKDINECATTPCQNGATCNDYVNSYTCNCMMGFSGTDCETNDEDCTSTSCMNGGTCVDAINNFTCICAPGYTGSNCQYHINECDSSPCLNGATCSDLTESYACHCRYGYTGPRCESIIDWCSMNPCANGGKCKQKRNAYECECKQGWSGQLCDISMVSCIVAARQKGVSTSNLCKNSGRCENTTKSHQCKCQDGYDGSYCQHEINECSSSPCQNGATCNDLVNEYTCDCPLGYQGINCEFNIDDCNPNPCRNGGTCHDMINKFMCSCPHGTVGILCEYNQNDCFEGACHHGGTCVDKVGGYECQCPPGFVGPRCEGDVNECLSNPCMGPGMQDCVQLENNYRCDCKPGYMGRHCEMKVNLCESSPCLNGGVCAGKEGGCICSEGFSGKNCQLSANDCDNNPCRNGGTCHQQVDGFVCWCPIGFKGTLCEHGTGSRCHKSNPCLNGGTCTDRGGRIECRCPQHVRGAHCEFSSPKMVPETTLESVEWEKKKCEINNCVVKSMNKRCDEECNTLACDFDNNDCSLGVNPWQNCTEFGCWKVFRDGKCDERCNNYNCLFDGFDCQQEKRCNPIYDAYCANHYANGFCDVGCNNEECNWDGLDCEQSPPKIVDGTIMLILLVDPEVLKKDTVTFVRELGHMLRTTVRIKTDENGKEMIYPWSASGSYLKGGGTTVYLEIDNRQCEKMQNRECFPNVQAAAQFLAAKATKHDLSSSFPIHEVHSMGAVPSVDAEIPYSNLTFIVIGALVIVMVFILVGVLVTTQRKKARGITWFPEGFLRSNSGQRRRSRRRGPDGQEMRNLHKHPSSNRVDANDNTMTPDSGQWSDEEISDHPSKRMKSEKNDTGYGDSMQSDYDELDPRPWTQQHLDAADVRNPDILALTPPQGEGEMDPCAVDVDVRGPGGFTPLMLASFRGGGLDTGDEVEEDDGSTVVIQDLLMQGAKLGSATDRTGESSLHLAARYARADAAKRLLDAGADANAQDNTGRSPLHAAVAADAQGVFQILLRNRATNLNARMNDGTTPLVLAARLAIEGMVDDLIAADADINAADDHGKTSLHWAAAVNNVDAVRVLLNHGANRDAQDNKEETPLFLAAREGSYEAARVLLDHFANRDIGDHMDRLPRDVAVERLHHDILQLLDEHVVHSPQVMPNMVVGSPGLMHAGMMGNGNGNKPPRPKKRSKTIVGIPGKEHIRALGSPGVDNNTMTAKKRASVKRKKDHTGNASPAISLESPQSMTGFDGDSNLYNGHGMAMSHPNLTTLDGSRTLKQPPAYEDCMKNAMHGMNQGQFMGGGGGGLLPHHLQQLHVRQNSLPASALHSHHHVPNSVQVMNSPIKQRPSLPTSPTHIVAMRHASHQKHGQMSPMTPSSQGNHQLQTTDFNNQAPPDLSQMLSSVPQQQRKLSGYHQYQYPTPPSQHSNLGLESTPQHMLPPENYLTPSPESPGQWSSSSPHSAHSDWSEGISSPVAPSMGYAMPQMGPNDMGVHMAPNDIGIHRKVSDGVYI
uniref:Notch n=1 Tax=Strigamia maritima TaxID=126957 RepID=T1IJR3_STRMM